MVTEKVILSYKKDLNVIILRPATVCGFSKRMRLDVVVNMLTFQALKDKKIIIFGGKQKRPNVHIDDLIDAYLFFLKKNVKSNIFNIGFENLSILEIGKIITKHIKSKIIIKKNSNDPRSYNLDSTKLLKIGYKPKKTIEDATMYDPGDPERITQLTPDNVEDDTVQYSAIGDKGEKN